MIIGIHTEIENELKRMGKYSEYREMFLRQRLTDFRHRYCNNMQEKDKEVYRQLVQSALMDEDWDFLQKTPQKLPDGVREFYDTVVLT